MTTKTPVKGDSPEAQQAWRTLRKYSGCYSLVKGPGETLEFEFTRYGTSWQDKRLEEVEQAIDDLTGIKPNTRNIFHWGNLGAIGFIENENDRIQRLVHRMRKHGIKVQESDKFVVGTVDGKPDTSHNWTHTNTLYLYDESDPATFKQDENQYNTFQQTLRKMLKNLKSQAIVLSREQEQGLIDLTIQHFEISNSRQGKTPEAAEMAARVEKDPSFRENVLPEKARADFRQSKMDFGRE